MSKQSVVLACVYWCVTVALAVVFDPAHAAAISMGAGPMAVGGLIVAAALKQGAEGDADKHREGADVERQKELPKVFVGHRRIGAE
jgi:hypothetical protein